MAGYVNVHMIQISNVYKRSKHGEGEQRGAEWTEVPQFSNYRKELAFLLLWVLINIIVRIKRSLNATSVLINLKKTRSDGVGGVSDTLLETEGFVTGRVWL